MDQVTELSYALDTFYFLVCGALVMWMAAGFTMLEAGLVRSKNTAEILTKNIGLYAIACIMYMAVGYNLMYPGDFSIGSFFGFAPAKFQLIGTHWFRRDPDKSRRVMTSLLFASKSCIWICDF